VRRRAFLGAAGTTAAHLACGGASASSPTPAPSGPPAGAPFPWLRRRGANGGVTLTEKDVADLAATGANLLRLSFPGRPLMGLAPPHAFDEGAFAHLERVLDWCEPRGVAVLVDPHRLPGTAHPYTMLGSDPFWQDFRWHDLAARLWEEIARRLAPRGAVVAGYDLLNEPEVRRPIPAGTPGDLNLLYRKLAAAIRAHDARHTIVLAGPRFFADGRLHGYHEGLGLLEVPADANLCFETHSYDPTTFTFQGVEAPFDPGLRYPGVVDGVSWNRERQEAEHRPVVEFARRTGRPLLIGEFSATRWLGEDGNRWVGDVVEVAEANGWSWAYHAWREFHGWDAEMSNTSEADRTRHASTPRLDLLKGYYARNTR
jgi:endoglucanase